MKWATAASYERLMLLKYLTRLCGIRAVARFHGLEIDMYLILGLRCAPPQALCCHPLRGLRKSVALKNVTF